MHESGSDRVTNSRSPGVTQYSRLVGTYSALAGERSAYNSGVDRAFSSLARTQGAEWLDVGSGDATRALRLNRELRKTLTVLEPSSLLPSSFESDYPSVGVIRGQIEDADFGREFDIVSMLWNVVGHLESLRATLLKVHERLSPSGVLFFDANSCLNVSRFGVTTVMKNFIRRAPRLSFPWPDEDSKTSVNFYSRRFLKVQLTRAGFSPSFSYINYDTGLPASSAFDGSMVIVAKKRLIP